MPDPASLVRLAVQQRDEGSVLVPSSHATIGHAEYDAKMSETWGGPLPRLFPLAVIEFPQQYASATKRTALITGGSGGIGFYVARLLCQVGLAVMIPARPGLEHEANAAVQAIMHAVPGAQVWTPEPPLDLGDFTSVRKFGREMRRSKQRIDTLVLNAGRGGAAAGSLEASVDGHELIMQVNLLSHALLTAELLPLLNRSDHCRVAAMSSGARFNVQPTDLQRDLGASIRAVAAAGYSPWAQYSRSKAGACLFARGLSKRLAAAHVAGAASCADPGLAATGVNVQHDLAATLGGRYPDTKALHDRAAHHAADGALPLARAALDGADGAIYAHTGGRAGSLSDATARLEPPRDAARGRRRDTRALSGAGRTLSMDDPAAWPEAVVEAFWARLAEATPGLDEAWDRWTAMAGGEQEEAEDEAEEEAEEERGPGEQARGKGGIAADVGHEADGSRGAQRHDEL